MHCLLDSCLVETCCEWHSLSCWRPITDRIMNLLKCTSLIKHLLEFGFTGCKIFQRYLYPVFLTTRFTKPWFPESKVDSIYHSMSQATLVETQMQDSIFIYLICRAAGAIWVIGSPGSLRYINYTCKITFPPRVDVNKPLSTLDIIFATNIHCNYFPLQKKLTIQCT